MEMKNVKMGLIGVLVLCVIFGSKIHTVMADASDCYDACTTACVQRNSRLQSRCEIKCGIKCDRGLNPIEVSCFCKHIYQNMEDTIKEKDSVQILEITLPNLRTWLVQEFEFSKPTVRITKLRSTKMKVTIKESSMVRPSEDTPSGRIWLSNLELMYPPFYAAAAALVFDSDGSPDFFHAKLLNESLSKVLVTFYPLAGRLVLDENGRREIDCNGQGVTFVEAEADCPMADYTDFPANKYELLPAVDFQKHFSSNPLILLQATKFSCGGVLLAIREHHNVVDGRGGTHFVNAWSEVARGQPISVPPVFDRSFLRARDLPTPKFHHDEYDPPFFTPQIENGSQSFEYVIKIPMKFINLLKSKVHNEEVK